MAGYRTRVGGGLASVSTAMFLAAVVGGAACHRSPPTSARPPSSEVSAAAGTTCETVARMDLTAMRAIPGLRRVPALWFESRSGEMGAALRAGGLDPFEGMDRAVLCQRRSPGANGNRESSIVFAGPGAFALFDRMLVAGEVTKQRWGDQEVLHGEHSWVAKHNGAVILATSEAMLKRSLKAPLPDEPAVGGGLFSLTLSGNALADVLTAGKSFRAAALNGLTELQVMLSTDASQVTARLAASDEAAAETLLHAIEQALKAAGNGFSANARQSGANVIVTAGLSREILDRFISAATAQATRSRAPVAMAPHVVH